MNAADMTDPRRHPLADGGAPDWASEWGQDRFGVFVRFELDGVRQRMRWIPPGGFLMGSPEDEKGRFGDEGPVHEVILATGFWLFDTPVTQALWQAVMADNPSQFKTPDRPVEQVSWKDSQDFIERINQRLPGLDLSLPSEAQWEYACRAGSQTALYPPGPGPGDDDEPVELDAIAWYRDNSNQEFELAGGRGTHPVALKQPNRWGLYDMLGNVWEWTADAWQAGYAGAPLDGSARPGQPGVRRVLRGGSWSDFARYARSAVRYDVEPGDRDDNLGLRCARVQVR